VPSRICWHVGYELLLSWICRGVYYEEQKQIPIHRLMYFDRSRLYTPLLNRQEAICIKCFFCVQLQLNYLRGQNVIDRHYSYVRVKLLSVCTWLWKEPRSKFLSIQVILSIYFLVFRWPIIYWANNFFRQLVGLQSVSLWASDSRAYRSKIYSRI
jgi:hypothetical protein